jgi:hypothetical protein
MDRHLLDAPVVWLSLGDNIYWIALTPNNLLWASAAYVVDLADGHWITDSIDEDASPSL